MSISYTVLHNFVIKTVLALLSYSIWPQEDVYGICMKMRGDCGNYPLAVMVEQLFISFL